MARLAGVIFGLLVLALSQYAAAQTVHVVGDNQGWTVGGADLYVNWARGKSFAIGDILTFNFVTNEHDVLRVPKASYDACSESNGIGDIISTGPLNITLQAASEHYYICTVGRHCVGGQKLAINVSETPGASPPNATPTPTPPTTPTTPSPASNTPEACAPTPGASTTPGSPGPSSTTSPPLPGSSSSKALASGLVSFGAIVMALLF